MQLCKLLRGCPAEKDVVNSVYQRVDKVSNQKSVPMEKYLLLDSNFFFFPELFSELGAGCRVCSGNAIMCVSPPVK